VSRRRWKRPTLGIQKRKPENFPEAYVTGLGLKVGIFPSRA
jgi:hypothetical protein